NNTASTVANFRACGIPADPSLPYVFVDLTPTSDARPYWFASGASGAQQVGQIVTDPLLAVQHAAIWSGSPESVVDLHPTGLGFQTSRAYCASGGLQAGYGSTSTNETHALLWAGTAASAVELHPTSGYVSSFANSISGSAVAGYGTTSSRR